MRIWAFLSGLVGLATGLVMRETQPAPWQDDPAPGDSVAHHHREPPERAEKSLPTGPLRWGIRGDLSFQEIIDLPDGARRDAEAILWAQSASSDEIGELWNELIQDSYFNRRLLPLLLSVWVGKDPEGAFDHAGATRFEGRFFAAWARVDPDQALAKARERGSYAFGKALAGLAKTDPHRAMALLDECNRRNRFSVSRAIAKGLMKQDPREALDFLADQGLRGLEGEILEQWASLDPGEAFEWALQRGSYGANTIVESVFFEEPDLAASLVEGMPTGRLKRSLQIARAKILAREDPEAAIQFIKKQASGIRNPALNQIGEELPLEASELRMDVLQTLLEGEGYQTPRKRHFPGWIMTEMLRDPPSVISLYEQHDAEGLPTLINGWVKKDPDRSVTWLSSQTDHESYDRMVEYIFFRSWLSDPAVTDRQMLGLLSQTNDAARANSYSRKILRTWQRRDPEGLANFLESGSATPEQLKWWEEQSR